MILKLEQAPTSPGEFVLKVSDSVVAPKNLHFLKVPW